MQNGFKIKIGQNLQPITGSTVTTQGDLAYNASTNQVEVFTTGTESVTTTTNTQTLSNKTLVAPALGTPVSGVATNLTGTAAGLTAGTVTTNANLTGDITSSGNATTYSGTVPLNKGGTGQTTKAPAFDALSPMTTGGDIIYGGASGTGTRLANGSSGQALLSSGGTAAPTWGAVMTNPLTTLGDMVYENATPTPTRLAGNITTTKQFLSQTGTGSISAAPAWSSFTAPTIQKFTTTGTQTGWLFTISTSSTVAVGDTYKENNGAGNTYTVLGALTAQSGQVLFMSGSSSAATTPLVRQTGSGTSSISFTSTAAIATYTTAANALYIRIRGVGAGGGGGSNGTGDAAGTTGTPTFFGANLITLGAGAGGSANSVTNAGSSGGSPTIGSGPVGLSFGGANSTGSSGVTTNAAGGAGASSYFGGAGNGGGPNGNGGVAVTNSGSGGGGAGGTGVFGGTPGGASGAFCDLIITSPAATYPYRIGVHGNGATNGVGGLSGGNGADGILEITESYQ